MKHDHSHSSSRANLRLSCPSRSLLPTFLLLLLLLLTGCAGPLYGGLKADDERLRRVQKLALIAFTAGLPIEGSAGYGIVRVGAMDEGGMFQHGQALVTDAADRFDNELRQDLKGMEYIPLTAVRQDELYQVLVKKETGSVVAARGTVDLIRSARDVDLEAVKKIAARLGADAVVLVYNTFRFYKYAGWYAAIEPAIVHIYSADGRLLLDGRIQFTSDRWDIARSTELNLEEEQKLLKDPVEKLAQWLAKSLRSYRP